jgi:hypothetical protein
VVDFDGVEVRVYNSTTPATKLMSPVCPLTHGQSPTLNLGQCTVVRVLPGLELGSQETSLYTAAILGVTHSDVEQRLWRTFTKTRYQRTGDKVRLQNLMEAPLEQAHIKLFGFFTDLLAVSDPRMLQAVADGETDSVALAALAEKCLRATRAQLCRGGGLAPNSTWFIVG